jgi:hypothetical protein
MKVTPTAHPEVLLIEPVVFKDARGFFLESFHAGKFRAAGLPVDFVQDNHSRSSAGVLRGLHYQLHHPQGKLVHVVTGSVYDVAVDIRRGSPRFGQWGELSPKITTSRGSPALRMASACSATVDFRRRTDVYTLVMNTASPGTTRAGAAWPTMEYLPSGRTGVAASATDQLRIMWRAHENPCWAPGAWSQVSGA